MYMTGAHQTATTVNPINRRPSFPSTDNPERRKCKGTATTVISVNCMTKRAWERQREKIVHKLTELGGRERESQREKAEMNEAFSKLLLDRDLEVLFVHACLQAPYSDPNTYLT